MFRRVLFRSDAATAAIRDAARPIVVAGRGCRADAAPWLRAFAESTPAPVLVTAQGKGALADPHPLAIGMLEPGHPLLARADLIVALGVAGEVEASTWPTGAQLLEVVGDPAVFLAEMAERLRGDHRADWDVAELDRIKRALLAQPTGGGVLTLAQVVAIVREATPVGTRATSDLAIARFWQAVLPGDYLAETETPGFAIAAAIAASLADPARRTVAFTDARGLAETELATGEAFGAPVVVVVISPAEGVSGPDELRRAFDAAWRSEQPRLVRARLSSSPC